MDTAHAATMESPGATCVQTNYDGPAIQTGYSSLKYDGFRALAHVGPDGTLMTYAVRIGNGMGLRKGVRNAHGRRECDGRRSALRSRRRRALPRTKSPLTRPRGPKVISVWCAALVPSARTRGLYERQAGGIRHTQPGGLRSPQCDPLLRGSTRS